MTVTDTSSVAIAADPMPLGGFSRLTQRTVTADVVDQIKRLITMGTLVPGQRLPSERVLADLLGVSRPTTREAVRALEAMGILSTRHGSGTFVTDLSAETLARPLIFVLDINRNALHELFAVRVLLEAGAAEAAAASADLDTFDQIVHQASGNALISALMNGLRALTRASLLASAAEEPARREAADEHEAILAALRQRDGAAAAQAMRQ